eukprot:gene6275-6753_t
MCSLHLHERNSAIHRPSFCPKLENSVQRIPSILEMLLTNNKEALPSQTPRSSDKSAHRRKRVKFQSTASVVLIPTKDEYIEAGLFYELWYTEFEREWMESTAIVDLSLGRK